jgi:copper(I)-binding protein
MQKRSKKLISKVMANMRACIATAIALSWALGSSPVAAQSVEVKGAWVRGTVPGQKGTGAFMEITSTRASRLVAVASPAAGVVEIHSMKMEGSVMKMFAVNGVDLPANRTVKLAPGGYHVMMTDLKQTLKAGDRVPLKLTFEMADKTRETLDLTVEVRDVTGAPKHGHH